MKHQSNNSKLTTLKTSNKAVNQINNSTSSQASAASFTHSKIMQLQSIIGNQAVGQMINARQESSNYSGEVAQTKLQFESGTEYLDASNHSIPYEAFNKVQNKAAFLYSDHGDLTFQTGDTGGGAAFFRPSSDLSIDGDIVVKPISEQALSDKTTGYHDRLVEVTHETHHAIDHCEDLDLKNGSYTDKIISEFRTFAVQSALAAQIHGAGKSVSDKYTDWQQSLDPDIRRRGDNSKDGFAPGNKMFETIKSYLTIYSKKEHNDRETQQFINDNQGELDRALNIYHSLLNNTKGEHDTYIDKEKYEVEGTPVDLGDGVTLTEITEHTRNVRKDIP